ncbi:hypothetical protein CfE428DRAFT_5752 [Chthoniobacter flavus Ellin428]|uniref:Uncharacterized protein n=1 Tax=Chthoniobacter flavus Ellin428 TaxID=497964 RepID=B4DA12_9BACT|nr:hypothetical protein CfE428DRAFT_5752 [Chthoniobacter flavus Ellin428]
MIDRHVHAHVFAAAHELEAIPGQDRVGVWREDVNVVGLESHAVADFPDGHAGDAGEEFRELALVSGIEMHDDHETHAGVGGEMLEQGEGGLETAGGGADADDGE